jgi:hypothetical protein
MAHNYDLDKPFKLAKTDIADGFWRLVVSKEDAWNFTYVLPSASSTTSIDDVELVVPTALQMGWRESPPFFCAATETARDVIEQLLTLPAGAIPPHALEHYMYNPTTS